MKNIPIIYSFARSGGTLVNQLLGVHPDCLILSEVNPAASVAPITRQAADWLNLIETTEVDRIQELSYAQQISLLDERAKSKGKLLIIRDWVTANYLPGAGNSAIVSSSILEQPIYLAQVGYALKPIVITRKAQDIYQSIRRSFSHLANMPLDFFSSSYLAYADAVSAFPKISLEALQSAPRETLVQILQELGLSTDQVDMQLETFADFHMCTGNNTLTVPSTTSDARQIVPVNRASVPNNESMITETFRKANRLMGYEV